MRIYPQRKATVEEIKRIPASILRDYGQLAPGQSRTFSIQWEEDFFYELQSLLLTATSSQLLVGYNVPADQDHPIAQTIILISWTECHYGGKRTWFLCPACGRRCGVLYWPSPTNILACRNCYGLGYDSQRRSKKSTQECSDLLAALDLAWAVPGGLSRRRRQQSPPQVTNRYTAPPTVKI